MIVYPQIKVFDLANLLLKKINTKITFSWLRTRVMEASRFINKK